MHELQRDNWSNFSLTIFICLSHNTKTWTWNSSKNKFFFSSNFYFVEREKKIGVKIFTFLSKLAFFSVKFSTHTKRSLINVDMNSIYKKHVSIAPKYLIARLSSINLSRRNVVKIFCFPTQLQTIFFSFLRRIKNINAIKFSDFFPHAASTEHWVDLLCSAELRLWVRTFSFSFQVFGESFSVSTKIFFPHGFKLNRSDSFHENFPLSAVLSAIIFPRVFVVFPIF